MLNLKFKSATVILSFVAFTLLFSVIQTETFANPPKNLRISIGDKAPSFTLENLHQKQGAISKYFDVPTIIVVGMKRKSAPHCKKWIERLLKDYPISQNKLNILQVVVIDKPWYIPKGIIRGKLRGYVKKFFYNRFFVDWGDRFGKVYQVKKMVTPTLLGIDKNQRLRFKFSGYSTDEASVLKVLTWIKEQLPQTKAKSATSKPTTPDPK